jgi:sugar lactone lactonase YvrE
MEKVMPVFEISTEHGEGPVWDPVEEKLYWVDLLEGKYLVGDFSSLKTEAYTIGQPLGVLALREKGGLVMGVRDGFGFFDESTGRFELIEPSPEQENAKVRFNDGAVDPTGRFFAGTMEWDGKEDIGKLFRLDADQSWYQLEENIFITNGMGWNPGKDTFYFIDTLKYVMYAYDYDLASGQISKRRVHIQFPEDELPDGMSVDSNGGFWVALYGAGKVVHFDKEGTRLDEIIVPAAYTTSCCFGGPDMNILFITTSKLLLDETARKKNPLAGRTFMIETNTVGQIEPKYRG